VAERVDPSDVRVPRNGLLLVAVAATLWGTSGLTATLTYRRGLDPLVVSFYRVAIGAALLFSLRRRSVSLTLIATADRARLLLIAAGLAIYQAGYFVAVQRAGVSIATLVTLGLAPVLVTSVARLRSRQPAPWSTVAGIGLAIVGLLALVGLPAERGAEVLVGAGFAALLATGYALMTLGGGALGIRIGAERLTALSFAFAALVLAPPAMSAGLWSVEWSPSLIIALLYLGIVPTAIAYRAFFSGLQDLPAPVAAVVALLEPLVATGLAIPLLGERLSPAGWLGAVALLAAVALVSGAHRSSAAETGRA